MKSAAAILLAFLPFSSTAQYMEPITNCAALADALSSEDFLPRGKARRLDLTARVTHFGPRGSFYALDDASGGAMLSHDSHTDNDSAMPGDFVRATGVVSRCAQIEGHIAVSTLRHGPPPTPLHVSAREFALSRDCAFKLVRMTGTVQDVFHDDIDSMVTFWMFSVGDEYVFATTPSDGREPDVSLIGRKFEITGICNAFKAGVRPRLGRLLNMTEKREIVAHDGGTASGSSPSSPGRRPATGRVLAIWKGGTFLMRTKDGDVSRVEPSSAPPPCGTCVEVMGFPETDLYNVNYTRALWKTASADIPAEPCCTNVTIAELTTDARGRTGFKPWLHGRTVRFLGTVRNVPASPGDAQLLVEDSGHIALVDASANPGILSGVMTGCRVEATGVCVLEKETWRPSAAFPRIRNLRIVPTGPGGVRIVSRPPWLTSGRMLAIVGVLLLVLAASTALNITFRKLITQRTRELERQILEHVSSELRVHERTRLAVELHDAISQNLTGLALELRALGELPGGVSESGKEHLAIAARTLGACRSELKNCIWDLRHDALENTNMDEAIRQTLSPRIGTTGLSVRFPVPRSRLTDNTAFAILRILRELATNAVRHGLAKNLKVAGAVEHGMLRFVLQDDGVGFDTATAPGIDTGHFGLQGVRERVAALNGNFEIKSSPGAGTRAIVSLPLKKEFLS